MTCSTCLKAQKDGFFKYECDGIEHVEKCPRGMVPKLSYDNYCFWDFFHHFLIGLVPDEGAYNLSVLKDIMDVYDISRDQRPIFYDLSLIVLLELEAVRKIERAKAQQKDQQRHQQSKLRRR